MQISARRLASGRGREPQPGYKSGGDNNAPAVPATPSAGPGGCTGGSPAFTHGAGGAPFLRGAFLEDRPGGCRPLFFFFCAAP